MRALWVIAAVWTLSVPVHAQDATASADGSSAEGVVGTSIVVRAGTDSSDAALSVSMRPGWWDDNKLNRSHLEFAFATPLDKKAGYGTFITDTGAFGATSLTASFKGVAQGPVDYEGPLPVPGGPPIFYSASYSVGRKTYEVRDPLTLVERDEEHTPYSVALRLGVLPSRRAQYFGVGIERKVFWKAEDDRTLCSPPPSSGPQECFTGPSGAPARRQSDTGFALFRMQDVLGSNGSPFGLEIKGAYDFRQDSLGAAASLYAFQDKDLNLRGGLRISWDEAEDETMAIIFVGAAFSLF